MKLREYREQKKYSRSELGALVGVAERTIMAYELGDRKPSVKVAMKIAQILDFDWTLFYEKSDDVDAFEDGSERDGGN